MSREEIIEKIQKLMALGDSPNPHEAELASQKAAELLAKYDITMMDVIARKSKDGTIMDLIHQALFDQYGEGNYIWEGTVLVTLCNVFECDVVRRYKSPGTDSTEGNKREFVLFGTSSDLSIVSHFFRFLRMRITNNQRKMNMNKKESYFYAQGVMSTISDRLRDMYRRKQDILKAANTRDIVVIKNDLVEKAKRKMFPKLIKKKPPQAIDRNAFMQGANDGEKIPISRPIEGGGKYNYIN